MSTALDLAMNETFERVESGASLSFPAQASTLRHGGFVLIQGEPYKVSVINLSKTGKHGGMKMHIVGHHLFTGKSKDALMMSTDNIMIPNVDRIEYQLIWVDREGYMSLFLDGKEKKDLRLGETRVEQEVLAAFKEEKELLVTIQFAMGQEGVFSFREEK